MHSVDVERSGPTVPRETELGQPLVRPSRHDRLPGGMAGRVVVKAPLRTGLGVAAGPNAQVHSVDRRTIERRLFHQQGAECGSVDAACAQRLGEAAPAAPIAGLETEVGQRGDRIARQQGIAQLEEGIGAVLEARMQRGAEGAQVREVMCGHSA